MAGVVRCEMTIQRPSEVVLEVAPEDQRVYLRGSVREYLRDWNDRVSELGDARRAGDLETAARLAEELRHVWPRPNDVADAAWIPERERPHPLRSDRGL